MLSCDEKFVPGRRCKRLFVIEAKQDVDSDDNDPQSGSAPEISLAALTGIQPRSSQTMWLRVEIGSSTLVASLIWVLHIISSPTMLWFPLASACDRDRA